MRREAKLFGRRLQNKLYFRSSGGGVAAAAEEDEEEEQPAHVKPAPASPQCRCALATPSPTSPAVALPSTKIFADHDGKGTALWLVPLDQSHLSLCTSRACTASRGVCYQAVIAAYEDERHHRVPLWNTGTGTTRRAP